MPPALHVLILAAGASSRMKGRDKLLEGIDGQPLIARLAQAVLDTGLPATIVLPPDRPLRVAAIAGLPLRRVIAHKARDGMAESLKAGLAEIGEETAIMVLLADLPEIDQNDIKAMQAAHLDQPGQILRATDQTKGMGHPVIFPADLRAELMALEGDEGARAILKKHADRIQTVTLPGHHATTDLDTPEDWENWRKSRFPPKG